MRAMTEDGINALTAWLAKAGVKSTFVDGLRVTDEATMEVVEMVLSLVRAKQSSV